VVRTRGRALRVEKDWIRETCKSENRLKSKKREGAIRRIREDCEEVPNYSLSSGGEMDIMSKVRRGTNQEGRGRAAVIPMEWRRSWLGSGGVMRLVLRQGLLVMRDQGTFLIGGEVTGGELKGCFLVGGETVR